MVLGIDASQANRKIRSGTEWYAFYLISEIIKLLKDRPDVKVRLYVRDPLQGDLVKNFSAQGGPASGWEVKILKWPFAYFWGQIRLSVEMLFNPPDVLFCPAHTIPAIHPKKTFTTLHDVGFRDNPELYDKLSLWYHRFSAWFAIKKAAHIFTVSEFSKQRIVANYNSDPNKISVTYLGIDKTSAIADKLFIEEFGLREKSYVLYVGRLEPKKNVLNMIKGYEMSGIAMPFVIAGRKIRIDD